MHACSYRSYGVYGSIFGRCIVLIARCHITYLGRNVPSGSTIAYYNPDKFSTYENKNIKNSALFDAIFNNKYDLF